MPHICHHAAEEIPDGLRMYHVCRHPSRDKNNPAGFILCENLCRFDRCPRGLTGDEE